MRLGERQEIILDFIVRDYTRTGCPVSSHKISEKKKSFDLSPASIRNIMFELDEEGFLHQPHTSAGRAPTEKGYKYFVDNLMEEKNVSENIKADCDKIISNFKGDDLFDELAFYMAHNLKLFSGFAIKNRFFKRGFSEVLREPEFEEHNLAVEFAEFVDDIESNIKSNNGITIGEFGVVGYNFGDDSFLFSIGPKRMDYEKTSAMLKYLTKLL